MRRKIRRLLFSEKKKKKKYRYIRRTEAKVEQKTKKRSGYS